MKTMTTTPQTIQLPEGFTIRPVTLEDLDAALDLFNDCAQDQVGIRSFERGEVEAEWTHEQFDLANDTLAIFTPEGQMAAHQEVWTIKEPPVHPWLWGRVHPDYEGQGFGTTLLTWAEARARTVLDRVPEEVRVSMWAQAREGHAPTVAVFYSQGLKLIRHTFRMLIEMEAPPPAPVWPEGIRVRLYNHPEEFADIYRTITEIFRDHFGYVEQPFEHGLKIFKEFTFKDEHFDPGMWYVAEDQGQIAGISLCRQRSFENPDDAYVGDLGVQRTWRKRGLGLALLQHSFGELYRRGHTSVALHVDAENLSGALRLYEKAGMHVARRLDLYEKELRPGRELSTTTLEE